MGIRVYLSWTEWLPNGGFVAHDHVALNHGDANQMIAFRASGIHTDDLSDSPDEHSVPALTSAGRVIVSSSLLPRSLSMLK